MMFRGLNLLTNSGIADSETLGLERVAGIHEFAYYDLDTQRLHNFFLRPHVVTGSAKPGQEYTALASSYKDKHVLHKFSNWGSAIKKYQAVLVLMLVGLLIILKQFSLILGLVIHQNF